MANPDTHAEAIRLRAYEISQGPDGGSADENWLRAERELAVLHDYDTIDGDLEALGIGLSRVPLEAGATWRLVLPRGESVDAWEPGVDGLTPPPAVARLIEGVLGGKQLIPRAPASQDAGAIRLRRKLDRQRRQLIVHDPGTRLGDDPENLHQHRVAARRIRAYLRAARAHLDPAWRRSIVDLLRSLGEATGPVRDLDVLLEHVKAEVAGLDEPDRAGAEALVARLESDHQTARRTLLDALAGDAYRSLLWRLRLPPRLASDDEAVPLAQVARKEFRRLRKAAGRLGKHPDDTAIHSLRISLKRARYVAELSPPGGKAGKRFIEDARTLQDLLGEHQDAVVAERHLREATVRDSDTAAAFVAGRLAERQRVRRERFANALPAAWKRLRKSGRRWARRLIPTS